MRQITVISGKGGTGKTTVTAALAHLARNAVIADCDVDAPDLHLILAPEVLETQEFAGSKVAVKDDDICTSCGICLEHCRFDAITEDLRILEDSCEGCAVCEIVCPTGAIWMKDRLSGHAYRSMTRFGPMAHALLRTAEEASGKLVTLVRNNARNLAGEHGIDLIIIDGPPGIGCPVISAISGVDMVLVVTEPTLSALHDLDRVLGVAEHFGIPALVCINKHDINPGNARRIEEHCAGRGVEVIERIDYDPSVTEAMVAGRAVTEHGDGPVVRQMRALWDELRGRLDLPERIGEGTGGS